MSLDWGPHPCWRLPPQPPVDALGLTDEDALPIVSISLGTFRGCILGPESGSYGKSSLAILPPPPKLSYEQSGWEQRRFLECRDKSDQGATSCWCGGRYIQEAGQSRPGGILPSVLGRRSQGGHPCPVTGIYFCCDFVSRMRVLPLLFTIESPPHLREVPSRVISCPNSAPNSSPPANGVPYLIAFPLCTTPSRGRTWQVWC